MPAESDAPNTSSAREPRSTIADTHGLTPAKPPRPSTASSAPVEPSTAPPAKRRSPLEDSDEPGDTPIVAAAPSPPDQAPEPDTDPTPTTGDDVSDYDSEVTDNVTVTDPETSPANGDADGIFPPVVNDDSGARDGGSGPIWSSTAFLVILGIVVMAGIGYAVFALFLKPGTVQLPTQNVVAAPVEPTLDPVAVTDPSTFLAAMPTTVGAYVLTEYTVQSDANPEGADEGSELPEGVAEIDTLTYSDGSSEIVVTPFQHYNISEAQSTFEELNVDGSDLQPVVVAGEEVGNQVTMASDAGPTVLWINNTAVFTATGDDDSVVTFVGGFGF